MGTDIDILQHYTSPDHPSKLAGTATATTTTKQAPISAKIMQHCGKHYFFYQNPAHCAHSGPGWFLGPKGTLSLVLITMYL